MNLTSALLSAAPPVWDRSICDGLAITAQQPALAPTTSAALKLLVKGFSAMERRLLEGTVKLSQRRAPRIELLGDADGASADVVMVDAHDAHALQWAAAQPWLAHKAVIWAGAKTASPGHLAVDGVVWPVLPVLLYKALEQRQRQAPASAAATDAARPTSRRVLIVDDSLAVRVYLRSLLERQGVEVVDVVSAEAGIAAANAEPFACVLMDVLMPGIDGFEACRRIKARSRAGAALPVIMLTSKSSPFDRIRGKMAGCDTYLTKPVDAAQLYKEVARHITDLRQARSPGNTAEPLARRPSPPTGLGAPDGISAFGTKLLARQPY